MRVRTALKLLVAGSCWILFNSAQAEGDIEAGKYSFTTCSGCHAIPGYTNAYPTYHVPRLGGQHPDYIVEALKAYKTGKRNHDTMVANAANLSDEDMQNIAAFLSQFTSNDEILDVWGDASAGEAKANEKGCIGCHKADGESLMPTIPRLAGQFEDYLIKALKDYRSGARQNDTMSAPNGIASTLTDQEIADLAAFYSSQKPSLAVIDFDG